MLPEPWSNSYEIKVLEIIMKGIKKETEHLRTVFTNMQYWSLSLKLH